MAHSDFHVDARKAVVGRLTRRREVAGQSYALGIERSS
jgi:hypothetical protein